MSGFFGGPVGNRTPDLRNANATLYHLSYRPFYTYNQFQNFESSGY